MKATCGSRSTDHDEGTRRQSLEKRPKTESESLVERESMLLELEVLGREGESARMPWTSMSSSSVW